MNILLWVVLSVAAVVVIAAVLWCAFSWAMGKAQEAEDKREEEDMPARY